MYIVLRNQLGCELDRCQVFHDENIQEALLKFAAKHDVEVGDKYEVVDNLD